MAAKRRILILLAVILIPALPAAGSLLFYHFTKNPLLRPLGITREKLAEMDGQTDFLSIMVHIDWGEEQTDGPSKSQVREFISDVFSTRTDEVAFKFTDVPGDDMAITFVVGPNRYGPYPPDQMIEGVIPSTIALEMTKKVRAREEALANAGQ